MLRKFFSKPHTPVHPVAPRPVGGMSALRPANNRPATYSRVFRWKLPQGQVDEPKTVHIVGTFTNWKPMPLKHDVQHGTWQATIDGIPSGKTHHYMLLLDGHPTYDPHCDGTAIPHGHDEHQYQLSTEKGHRVLMLFAQAK